MNEELKKVLEGISQNNELRDKLIQMNTRYSSCEEAMPHVCSLLEEYGYHLTVEDLTGMDGAKCDFSEDELSKVAGGRITWNNEQTQWRCDCKCTVYGIGDEDEYQYECSCFLNGNGQFYDDQIKYREKLGERVPNHNMDLCMACKMTGSDSREKIGDYCSSISGR